MAAAVSSQSGSKDSSYEKRIQTFVHNLLILFHLNDTTFNLQADHFNDKACMLDGGDNYAIGVKIKLWDSLWDTKKSSCLQKTQSFQCLYSLKRNAPKIGNMRLKVRMRNFVEVAFGQTSHVLLGAESSETHTMDGEKPWYLWEQPPRMTSTCYLSEYLRCKYLHDILISKSRHLHGCHSLRLQSGLRRSVLQLNQTEQKTITTSYIFSF